MGFLNNLFGDDNQLDYQFIAKNMALHVPDVVQGWFNMSIKSFQKQIDDKNEIIKNHLDNEIELFIKVYYCFVTAQYINKQKLASQKMTGSFSINFLKNVLKNDFDRSTPIMSIFHTNMNDQMKCQLSFSTKLSEYIFGSIDEKYLNMVHYQHSFLLMPIHCSIFKNFDDINYEQRIVNSFPISHPNSEEIEKYLHAEIKYWEKK